MNGLDKAWAAFGSSLDALGQPFDSVFTRLRQRLAAFSTGLDNDCTLLLQRFIEHVYTFQLYATRRCGSIKSKAVIRLGLIQTEAKLTFDLLGWLRAMLP